MPVFLMTVPAAAFILASACPQPPPVKVHVVGRVDEIAIGTEFDLAQLRELSDRFGRGTKHRPLGYYVSQISGETSVSVGNAQQDLCMGPIEIEVTIELTSRHIEIAQDLRNNACQFNAAVVHYRQHARADAAVFQRHVVMVTQILNRISASDLFSAAGNSGVRGNTLVPVIQSIIKPALDEMHIERVSAIEAVDTPAEIRRLEQSCSDHL